MSCSLVAYNTLGQKTFEQKEIQEKDLPSNGGALFTHQSLKQAFSYDLHGRLSDVDEFSDCDHLGISRDLHLSNISYNDLGFETGFKRVTMTKAMSGSSFAKATFEEKKVLAFNLLGEAKSIWQS